MAYLERHSWQSMCLAMPFHFCGELQSDRKLIAMNYESERLVPFKPEQFYRNAFCRICSDIHLIDPTGTELKGMKAKHLVRHQVFKVQIRTSNIFIATN